MAATFVIGHHLSPLLTKRAWYTRIKLTSALDAEYNMIDFKFQVG